MSEIYSKQTEIEEDAEIELDETLAQTQYRLAMMPLVIPKNPNDQAHADVINILIEQQNLATNWLSTRMSHDIYGCPAPDTCQYCQPLNHYGS